MVHNSCQAPKSCDCGGCEYKKLSKKPPMKPSDMVVNPIVIEEGFGFEPKEILMTFIFGALVVLIAVCLNKG